VITFADLLVYGGCFWVFPPSSAMANPPDQQNILQEIAKAFAQDTGQQINASAAPASECAHSFPLFRLQQFFVFILTSYPCKSVHISMLVTIRDHYKIGSVALLASDVFFGVAVQSRILAIETIEDFNTVLETYSTNLVRISAISIPPFVRADFVCFREACY
jgi:hypothetical protein